MMHLFFESAWKVAVWGLVLGAGIPLIFSIGVRQTAGVSDQETPATLNRVIGVICFLVVVYLVASGLMIIIGAGQGKAVTFDHVIPTFTSSS
jgi:hypothetical protein